MKIQHMRRGSLIIIHRFSLLGKDVVVSYPHPKNNSG
jgi:hypothetical protein